MVPFLYSLDRKNYNFHFTIMELEYKIDKVKAWELPKGLK